MGVLKHLLLWPVSGPSYLARFSLEKVRGVVREELTDESRVKEALLDLQLRLELGEVDEEEYVREEARLMEELREVRRWRERFGMGTRGGVVQVGGDAGESGESGDAPRGGQDPGGAADEGEDESEAGARDEGVFGRGATLEVSVDFDDEEEDEGWSPEPDASDDASSSS